MTVTSNAHSCAAGPAWASWLGIVAVLLGVLLGAVHGNEWMKHGVVVPMVTDSGGPPAPDCPDDELAEEGLSVAECVQMARSVQDVLVSRPDWYRGFHMSVSALGLLLALGSIFAGVALVDYRRWAPAAAFAIFTALALIDCVLFAAVLYTGPLMRGMYLWNLTLWFFLHLTMAVAALAGHTGARAGTA